MTGGTPKFIPWTVDMLAYLESMSQTRRFSEDLPAYEAAMSRISQRPDTLILAFDNDYGRLNPTAYGAQLLPPFPAQHRISVIDSHLNVAGNREVAEAAIPVIAEWLAERDCE